MCICVIYFTTSQLGRLELGLGPSGNVSFCRFFLLLSYEQLSVYLWVANLEHVVSVHNAVKDCKDCVDTLHKIHSSNIRTHVVEVDQIAEQDCHVLENLWEIIES